MHCSPPGSSVHGDSPDKNTGVGYHALLQGIFPTQGSNPGLDSLPSEADSLLSEPPGKPMSLSELRELVMDREALRAVIHVVTKSRTHLSN